MFSYGMRQRWPCYALEIMNRTLKDIINNNLLFGGKIVILGDFRQLLTVLSRENRSELINLSIKNSFLWNSFTKFKLYRNMRITDKDIAFSRFLGYWKWRFKR